MLKKKSIVIFSFLILLMAILFYCSTMRVEANGESTMPMPKGLENVYLGMSINDLKKIKPNIKRDDWPYSPYYFEKSIGNNYFSFAMYKFSNDRLVVISISQEGEPDFIRGKILGLINGCLKKWGEGYSPYVRGVITNDLTKELRFFPIFYWEKPQSKIMMTYIITSKEKRNSHYEIVMFDPKFRLDEVQKYRETANLKELEEAFKDVPIAEKYQGLIFE